MMRPRIFHCVKIARTRLHQYAPARSVQNVKMYCQKIQIPKKLPMITCTKTIINEIKTWKGWKTLEIASHSMHALLENNNIGIKRVITLSLDWHKTGTLK